MRQQWKTAALVTARQLIMAAHSIPVSSTGWACWDDAAVAHSCDMWWPRCQLQRGPRASKTDKSESHSQWRCGSTDQHTARGVQDYAAPGTAIMVRRATAAAAM